MQKKFLKKFVITAGILLVAPVASFAQLVKVEALDNISTENPPLTAKVKILKDTTFNGMKFKEGTVLYGEITDVKDPKRLKRSATFSFLPKTYTTADGHKGNFPEGKIGKYFKGINEKGLAKTAAVTAGSHYVPGLGLGIGAIEGAIKNDNGNRIKSAGQGIYKASPLSYIEKGEELEIKTNDKFYLRFVSDDDDSDDEGLGAED